MFHFPLRLLYGLAALEEDVVEANLGASSGPDPCFFEDMNPIWLCLMWETRGSNCVDMIEILISLALLKLGSRL